MLPASDGTISTTVWAIRGFDATSTVHAASIVADDGQRLVTRYAATEVHPRGAAESSGESSATLMLLEP